MNTIVLGFSIFLSLILVVTYSLFCFVFYVPKHKPRNKEDFDLPAGKIYEPFYDKMKYWAQVCRNTPHKEFIISSHDGLKLFGKYYEHKSGAPIELMFHGYRGNAERDLSGGMSRCFKLGHNALIVDQRCSGKSEGNVITFGIKEYRDCLDWIDFTIQHFGPDVQIILTGISMGASTVLMAAGKSLPKNVIGVLADCGFHSAKEVIMHVAGTMHLPSRLMYPIVKFSARLFGHFDLEEITVEEAVKSCKVPVLFFHGAADDYVPSYMSQINYDACPTRKKLVMVPGAGHGLCYPVAPDLYIQEMANFFHENNLQ